MKNSDLQGLKNGLISIKDLKGIKLGYAAAKNMDKLDKELEITNKISEASEDYLEYDKKRILLCIKLAEKGPDKKPLIANGTYVIKEQAKFQTEWKKLKKKYKTALDEHEGKAKEVEKLMAEDCTIKWHKVKMEHLPETMSVEQLASIKWIIMDY